MRGEAAHTTRTLASVAGLKMGLTVRVQYLQNLGSNREPDSEFSSPFFRARSDFHSAWCVAMAACGVTYSMGVGKIQMSMNPTATISQRYSCDVMGAVQRRRE